MCYDYASPDSAVGSWRARSCAISWARSWAISWALSWALAATAHADLPPSAPYGDNALEQITYDLYHSAHMGHVHQIGPTIAPNAPGWERMRSNAASWRPPTLSRSGVWVAPLEGRGGSLDFPITEEDGHLDELSVWLEPAAPAQIVSIFLDEVLISNLSLSSKPRAYLLPLERPLPPGEHTLRFWFRASRPAKWGGRTPGSVGPIHLLARGTRPQAPTAWWGEILAEQQRWGALFAPPPTTWRFYFMPPTSARFSAHAWVDGREGARFEVRVAVDGQPERVIFSGDVEPERLTPIEADLSEFGGAPLRLSLAALPLSAPPTQHAPRPHPTRSASAPTVAWLSPRVLAPHPAPRALPSVRLALVWVIEGLKDAHIREALNSPSSYPTLARLAAQSWRLGSLWGGGVTPSAGHRALIAPEHSPLSTPITLPDLAREAGARSAFLSMDSLPATELTQGFDELYEPTLEGVAGHLEVIQHLGRLLHEQRRSPSRQLIYLTSSPFKRGRIKHGFAEDSVEEGALSLIDYELAYLLSELSAQIDLSDTLIALTGVPTGLPKRPDPPPGEPPPPESAESAAAECARVADTLEVGALVWSPRATLSAPPPAPSSPPPALSSLEGGHLSALSATLLQSLNDGAPPNWPFDSLSDYLLINAPLPPHAHVASVGAARLTRLGHLFLYEPAARAPSLWRRGTFEGGDLSHSHPVGLRVLRDALSSTRLSEGL
jgi:hypothetical protein